MAKNYKTIQLDPKYIPKKTEKYMSEEQKAYFYALLAAQRNAVVASMNDGMSDLSSSINIDSMDGPNNEGDDASNTQQADIQMKILDRDKNLLVRIDNALKRLEEGTFGYSVISGEEIGLKRMLVQPLATMTIDEKEEHDKKDF
ncbi:MAG: hypothetical protein FWE50_01910 [Alphaproteobacteria bacterium]|nr:hypothetical protein [Alphaproteobacteria bacterium]